ncbi:MAG: hypothetical protein NXI23_21080 [Bacteroidetes bacterium]|jgi:hypothetical protein|nr:hypothetical protein [Bacteroidota bacterium]
MGKEKLNILITGTGGPTPRSFARSLKKLGKYKDYCLFGTDINKYAIGLYQNDLFDKSFITPRSSEEGYWTAMEEIITSHNIQIAVITPEPEIYEWGKRKAEKILPCKALVPSAIAAGAMIDKAVLTKTLSSSGLVPESIDFRHEESNLRTKLEERLVYPFWVRSAMGTSGLGSFKIHDFNDLIKWMSINQEVKKFLASDYLPGRNLACKLLYFEGQLIRAAVGERVNYMMAKVAPSGVTGNTSFGRLLNDPEVFKVSKKAIELVFDQVGTERHGYFTVDLKEDHQGNPLVTEINIRPIGFNSTFASGGANIAEDVIRLLDNDSSFDKTFKLYEFQEGLIFLRDVDALPIVMNESNLLS